MEQWTAQRTVQRTEQQTDQRTGLRVGLTGGLGSGKSTVAAMLAGHGAHVLSADEIARGLMQPGEAVYAAIVQQFGPVVVCPDGKLDRAGLARVAFADGRVEELNAIVHPATIARQAELMTAIFTREPDAVVVVESALLFETQHGAGWRERFDKLVLVTAPEWLKVQRFISRSAKPQNCSDELAAEARRRLDRMIPDDEKAPQCDFIIANDGSLDALREQVGRVSGSLRLAAQTKPAGSFKAQ